ncbi:hypothetical protein OD350_28795 (plasmid) [Clostridium beijerinckii]|uniref:hypothetical protein n=1 Tax=Clostridium beijerinckii TaxID=1520 RepID=UPI002227569F|nr:hypothetical protein [Clostridium beijerinckii]UYZ39073.1 hypothetical protein OD350_28795 [Clostridium beijerinckii]
MKNSMIRIMVLSLSNYIILFSMLFWFYMLRHILTYFIESFELMIHTINMLEVSLETKCMGVLTLLLFCISTTAIKNKKISMNIDDIMIEKISQAFTVGIVVSYMLYNKIY